MKQFILILSLVLIPAIWAQNIYTPLGKARKSTAYIYVETGKQASRLMEKINKYPLCNGIKIDARMMTKQEISGFIKFIAVNPDITTLYIQYAKADSLDFNVFSELAHIETLCLQNPEFKYEQITQLNNLKHLYRLNLFIEKIEQLPLSVCNLNTIGEINLMTETYNQASSTELYLYYPVNDSLDNFIELNSYLDSIDLSADSTKKLIFSMWPMAEERKNTASQKTFSIDRAAFTAPDPVTYYQPNNNLKPLVKDTKPVFEKSAINPNTDNTILCKDETIINIPADAFMSASGKIVEGNVTLLYRSVRTPEDILSSGITMFYDTAGKTEMFKTNGMFEIRAFANSEELKLRPGKEITMDFKSNGDTGKFNLYNLNEKTGQWQYNKSLFMGGMGNLSNNNSMNLWTMTDKTEFADRYNDLSYTYILPKGIYTEIQVPTLSLRRHYANDLFKFTSGIKSGRIKQGKTLVRLITDPELSNFKARKVVFYLFNTNLSPKSVTGIYFPELQPFDGYAFEYDGLAKTSEFSKLYKKGKCYTDCRIYYENNADNAIIELKTKDGFIQIPVKTVIINAKGKSRPNNSFKRAYRKYLRLLSIKETKFNQTISKTLNRYSYVTNKIYSAVFTDKNPKKNTQVYQLNVSLLGFFNCDQLYRIKQPMYVVNSKFMCGDTLLQGLEGAYIVDNKAKGTYSFNPAYLMLSYENMGGIVLQNSRGEIYTCTGKEFREQLSNSNQQENKVIKVNKMSSVNADAAVKGFE